MQTVTLRWTVGLLLSVGVLAGCATDREKILIGSWRPSALAAPIMAAKLKQDTPSASGSTAMGGGRILTAAAIDVRKDKTFTLAWLGNNVDGTWTFDKKSGEMQLNVAKIQSINPAIPQVQGLPGGTWVAYLDPDNLRLRVYPMPKEHVAMLQKSGGPMADGIALKKGED
jgi:hypothetical protein